ncbi:hypothetical protein MVI01_58400 [Myxococcus virescens]|uniref:Uncharacterized protein n=1 Tax=Myxococcus virescens TaxID=83456 RepID=A0A511HKF8_9BACT|nr:hypothetical protein MVI01_58400 [Myxococcus virescens]
MVTPDERKKRGGERIRYLRSEKEAHPGPPRGEPYQGPAGRRYRCSTRLSPLCGPALATQRARLPEPGERSAYKLPGALHPCPRGASALVDLDREEPSDCET